MELADPTGNAFRSGEQSPAFARKSYRARNGAIARTLKRLLRLTELRDAGVTAATMSRMERDGEVLRLARGLYQLSDALLDANHSLAEAAKRVPKRRCLPRFGPRIPRPDRSASEAGLAGHRSEGLDPETRRYAHSHRSFHRKSAQ